MNRLLSLLFWVFGILITNPVVGQLPFSKHPDDLHQGNPAGRNSWFYLMGNAPTQTFNFYFRKQWKTDDIKGTPMTVGGNFDFIFGYNRNHLVGVEARLSRWGSLESHQFKGRYAINLNGAFGGKKNIAFIWERQ